MHLNITPSDVDTPITNPSDDDVNTPTTSPSHVDTPITNSSDINTPIADPTDDPLQDESGFFDDSFVHQEEPLDDSPYHQHANMFEMGEMLEESSSDAEGESVYVLMQEYMIV